MRLTILFFALLAATSCAHVDRTNYSQTCRPDGVGSLSLPNGNLIVNVVSGSTGKVDAEVVLWVPNSAQASSARMTLRWEAHSPTEIDFDRGMIMFDSERLWKNKPVQDLPKKLTVELRVHREDPWEGPAALRGSIALQFGVRLAADWADVKALASSQRELFLITRSRGAVVDMVPLRKSDFDLPLEEINAFRAEVRAKAAGPNQPCPAEEIIIT